jgi:hypothetical protein
MQQSPRNLTYGSLTWGSTASHHSIGGCLDSESVGYLGEIIQWCPRVGELVVGWEGLGL